MQLTSGLPTACRRWSSSSPSGPASPIGGSGQSQPRGPHATGRASLEVGDPQVRNCLTCGARKSVGSTAPGVGRRSRDGRLVPVDADEGCHCKIYSAEEEWNYRARHETKPQRLDRNWAALSRNCGSCKPECNCSPDSPDPAALNQRQAHRADTAGGFTSPSPARCTDPVRDDSRATTSRRWPVRGRTCRNRSA